MTSSHSKKAMLKDTLLYSLANYIVQFLGIVNSVALRRFTEPVGMGVWSMLQVILGYCGYASFGATKALARDYPILRAKGKTAEAQHLCDTTLTFSMAMSILPSLGILVYWLMNRHRQTSLLSVGLLFLSFYLFVQRFYDFIVTLLRSEKKFTLLSGLVVLNAVCTLLVTFVFVYKWQMYGLLAGTLVVTLTCIAFIYRFSPYRFGLRFHAGELKRELKLGIPLVGQAWLLEFLKNLDKLIIAKRLGFYELGLYSLATMANNYVFALPMMFSHVWFPNLQEAFGEKGDPSKIRHYLTKPVLIMSVIVPLLSGTAIFLMPALVRCFMPQYAEGLNSVAVYLCGTFFVLTAQFSSSFLVTVDRYWVNFPILAVSIGLNLFLSNLFIDRGMGITGVALGASISFFVYGTACYLIAASQFESLRWALFSVLKPLSFFLILSAFIFLIPRFVSVQHPAADLFAKLFVFALSAIPFLFWVDKETEVVRLTWGVLAAKLPFSRSKSNSWR